MSTLPATPGQTVGPFYGYALPWAGDSELVPAGHPDAIRLHGTVYDGQGDTVPDAILELWQADQAGVVPQVEGSLHRDGFTFTGFGRAAVDDNGHYSFTTPTPGATEPGRPAYFLITIFARGLLHRLITRAYLPDPGADPLLAAIDDDRRDTLIATRDAHGFVFDIRLQGEGETVFLDYPTP